ncbi:DUF3313 family protein [Paraburkholderia rhizosphaerae]|uniref:Uncharacterized protein DUF3313 n=1 Tax=Paraburkholderia rhizosphaerae TaxID=480658 RepID=A0A4R8LBT5_9BURK|nr:DUF3313 family protein [Paraburkholderia rhizosphaerae]TDY40416.1 uncharacterized protein DUF3313 [Paraburkholderia rhizosphaerae]
MKISIDPRFNASFLSAMQTTRAQLKMRAAWLLACAALTLALIAQPGVARAGYLIPDSVQLTPVAQFPGTTGYMAPDYAAQRARLHSVYLAPIEVFLSPDSPYKGIDPDQMAQVTRTFAQILTQEVMKDMTVVDSPRPDSLILQIALTDVRLEKEGFRLRNLTPVGVAINGVKRVAGVSKISFKTMTVQAIGASGDNETLLFAINNPPRPDDVPESVRLDEIPRALAAKAQNLKAAFEAIRDAH